MPARCAARWLSPGGWKRRLSRGARGGRGSAGRRRRAPGHLLGRRLDDGDQYASTAEVAEALVKLPRSPPRITCACRTGAVRERPAADRGETWLNPDDRAFLITMLARMRAAYDRLEFTLPPGVIHGDENVRERAARSPRQPGGDRPGRFTIGPRESDLALTAIYYDSFGWHTHKEYEDFVRVYGFDMMAWPGYPVMQAVREFLMVASVIQRLADPTRPPPKRPSASPPCVLRPP